MITVTVASAHGNLAEVFLITSVTSVAPWLSAPQLSAHLSAQTRLFEGSAAAILELRL
jgi:hypothetical protein